MPKYLNRFTSKATKPLMGLTIKFERLYKRSRSKQKVIVAADWKMMLKVHSIIKKEE